MKLAQENEKLRAELKGMSERLEAVERKRLEIARKQQLQQLQEQIQQQMMEEQEEQDEQDESEAPEELDQEEEFIHPD
jgi:hypothetical protein